MEVAHIKNLFYLRLHPQGLAQSNYSKIYWKNARTHEWKSEWSPFSPNCVPRATSQPALQCIHVDSCNTLAPCAHEVFTLVSPEHNSQLYHNCILLSSLQSFLWPSKKKMVSFLFLPWFMLCQQLYENACSKNSAHPPKILVSTSNAFILIWEELWQRLASHLGR